MCQWMTWMTADNALIGIIMAGIALCGAYFWAEIARRQRVRVLAEKRDSAMKKLGVQALLDADTSAKGEEAANDGALPAVVARAAHSRRD
jgi:hypothetical protein